MTARIPQPRRAAGEALLAGDAAAKSTPRRRAEPDGRIIARARAGDHTAFRQIVVAYQHKVHDLLARMLAGVVSLAEVEELAQEAFLRIYRALAQFEPAGPGALTKWILTVATRVGIDALRKRRLVQVPLDSEPRALARPPALDPATREYLSTSIADAVAALPLDQRLVLVLREYYDFDNREIARVLDLNPGTVKSRLSRARAALRTALQEARP